MTPPTARPRHQRRQYSKNLIHLVTAIKYRRTVPPQVGQFIEREALAVCKYLGIVPIAIAFDQNHLHILFDLPAHRALEEVARRLKALISKHTRAAFPELRELVREDALWQRRYLYATLGNAPEQATIRYIEKQKTEGWALRPDWT